MSIQVVCSCGKKLAARDEHAGKRVQCPSCGAVLRVPANPGLSDPALLRVQKPPAPANPREPAATRGSAVVQGGDSGKPPKDVLLRIRCRGCVLADGVKGEVLLDDKSLGVYPLKSGFAFGYPTRVGDHELELRYLGKHSLRQLNFPSPGAYELMFTILPSKEGFTDEFEMSFQG